MELRLVQARPVPEHAVILAETLAMIRSDDHPRPPKYGTAFELVDQAAELLVEIRHAIVVRVTTETDLVRRRIFSASTSANRASISSPATAWIRTESVDAHRRELIRIVCVVKIQEGEERPLRLPASGQPVEKLAIDNRRVLSIGLEEPTELIHHRAQEIEIQPIFEETARPPEVHRWCDRPERST